MNKAFSKQYEVHCADKNVVISDIWMSMNCHIPVLWKILILVPTT